MVLSLFGMLAVIAEHSLYPLFHLDLNGEILIIFFYHSSNGLYK